VLSHDGRSVRVAIAIDDGESKETTLRIQQMWGRRQFRVN
jgi:hypothetical protein